MQKSEGVNYIERYDDYKRFLLGLQSTNLAMAQQIKRFWNDIIFPGSAAYQSTSTTERQEDSEDDIDAALEALKLKPSISLDSVVDVSCILWIILLFFINTSKPPRLEQYPHPQ